MKLVILKDNKKILEYLLICFKMLCEFSSPFSLFDYLFKYFIVVDLTTYNQIWYVAIGYYTYKPTYVLNFHKFHHTNNEFSMKHYPIQFVTWEIYQHEFIDQFRNCSLRFSTSYSKYIHGKWGFSSLSVMCRNV